MTTFSDEALVIDSRPFREHHLLLTVLTPSAGPVRGILRDARGRRTARGAATAQLLSVVEISGFHKAGAELATFTEIELVASSYSLSRKLERAAVAACVAELLGTFCPPGEPAPTHFRLGVRLLQALLEDGDPPALLAYAITWMLRLDGVLPDLGACASCGTALTHPPIALGSDGEPRCRRCAEAGLQKLNARDIEFLGSVLGRPPGELSGPAPRGVTRWLQRLVREAAHRGLPALDFANTVL